MEVGKGVCFILCDSSYIGNFLFLFVFSSCYVVMVLPSWPWTLEWRSWVCCVTVMGEMDLWVCRRHPSGNALIAQIEAQVCGKKLLGEAGFAHRSAAVVWPLILSFFFKDWNLNKRLLWYFIGVSSATLHLLCINAVLCIPGNLYNCCAIKLV